MAVECRTMVPLTPEPVIGLDEIATATKRPCRLERGHGGPCDPVRRVVGFDPGSHDTAFAVVSLGRDAYTRPEIESFGRFESTRELAIRAIESSGARIVAIETPRGFVYARGGQTRGHGRGAERSIARHLHETARVAGDISGAAAAMGKVVIEVSAPAWRRALCGKGSAADARIRSALEMTCATIPAKWSAHARDAAGVAIYALRNPWPEPGRAAANPRRRPDFVIRTVRGR